MAYIDFLNALAELQGLTNGQTLLDNPGPYRSHIESRIAARAWIDAHSSKLSDSWSGVRVLDVGCGYGATSVELAKLGARVVGVDTNQRWLDLACANARNEVAVEFIKGDAESRDIVRRLSEVGPFDVVILKDVLHCIRDVGAVLENMSRVAAANAYTLYRVPNMRSIKHVMADPITRTFAIALLPNEVWPMLCASPPHFYARRLEDYRAAFAYWGYQVRDIAAITDEDEGTTRRHIERGLRMLKRELKPENFRSKDLRARVIKAYRLYAAEAQDDLARLDWPSLYQKYRAPTWEGVLSR